MAMREVLTTSETAARPAERYWEPSTFVTIWRFVWRFAGAKPLAAVGAFVLIIMVLTALAAPLIAGDPLAVDPPQRLLGPTLTHPFGTDNLGRDMFDRVVYGSRPSLYTGLIVVSVVSVLGVTLGIS